MLPPSFPFPPVALRCLVLVAAFAIALPVGAPDSFARARGRKKAPPAATSPSVEVQGLLRELAGELPARKAATDALVKLGPTITPVLIPLLEDPRWSYRWDVVNVLGYLEDPQAIPALVERVLGDDNPHVRWRSLWALAVTEREGVLARELFMAALADPVEFRRWNAAVGLSMFKDARAVASLHEGLSNSNPWVRWEAVNGLGRIHDATSSARIVGLLRTDGDDSVRQESTFVLGAICDAAAREALAAALDDAAMQVRWRAAMGLGRCGDPAGKAPLERRRAVETESTVLESIDDALEALARPRR